MICTRNGKRLLVDTKREPNYKELYQDENGNDFCTDKCEAPEAPVEALDPELWVCGECEKEYKTEKGLDNHLAKHE